ncbi:acyl-CoA thioesterase [Amycolatopsis aidingensis]|uniref:acyl-CoA thioesterase n=1 Tax=Amycolatopsis aidingensis TaxID=2842453 RepID=UPI001C0E4195|nr:thioesterase family protein [Amycolatopsis aidingensis]
MPLRVRYHECDPQGIVFNANYLSYLDMASLEFCKAAFGSYAALTAAGVDMVVAESNLRYRAASRFDEELVVAVRVEHIGNTSFTLGFEIHRGEALVLTASNRYVWVSTTGLEPTRPPAAIRDRLAAHLPADGG